MLLYQYSLSTITRFIFLNHFIALIWSQIRSDYNNMPTWHIIKQSLQQNIIFNESDTERLCHRAQKLFDVTFFPRKWFTNLISRSNESFIKLSFDREIVTCGNTLHCWNGNIWKTFASIWNQTRSMFDREHYISTIIHCTIYLKKEPITPWAQNLYRNIFSEIQFSLKNEL